MMFRIYVVGVRLVLWNSFAATFGFDPINARV
jgi:hypothetical protein